jgi:hypothetical protein
MQIRSARCTLGRRICLIWQCSTSFFLKIRNIPALIKNKKAARTTAYMRELRSLTQPRLHRAKETEKDYSLPKCTTAGGSGANLRAKDQQWAVFLISSNTPIADFL